jgi:hypothetical protein
MDVKMNTGGLGTCGAQVPILFSFQYGKEAPHWVPLR